MGEEAPVALQTFMFPGFMMLGFAGHYRNKAFEIVWLRQGEHGHDSVV
jgi:hypothetical protein